MLNLTNVALFIKCKPIYSQKSDSDSRKSREKKELIFENLISFIELIINANSMKKINSIFNLIFKSWVFYLSLLFFFHSCREESLSLAETQAGKSNQDYKINSVNKISYGELLQKLPHGTLNENLKFSITPINGKTIEEFDIDSTNVNQIQFGEDANSYTMKVIPKSGENPDEELYNLTISQVNENIEYKIIKYILEDGKLIADENHTETEYNTSNRVACYRIVFPCEFGYYHDDAHCQSSGWTVIYSCQNSGGGGGTGGGGNGPGNPTGDGPTVPTGNHHNPQDDGGTSYQYEYYYFLTQPQISWLSQRPSISKGIDDYIRNSSNYEQALEFAKWATNFLMQNSGMTWAQFQNLFIGSNNITVTSSVNSTNSIKFNSWKDFKNALDIKNSNLIFENSVISDNGSEKILSAKIKRTGIWNSGVEILVKLKKVNNIWVFDSVTSSEYGITLGAWSFTQLSYSQNTNLDKLIIEVIGYENYNIFSEGIGTIYKDKVKYTVTINNSNGTITNIQFTDL